MKVKVNGSEIEVKDGATVLDLVQAMGIEPKGIAFAIGGDIVSRDKWELTVLTDGADVMAIRAVCGG